MHSDHVANLAPVPARPFGPLLEALWSLPALAWTGAAAFVAVRRNRRAVAELAECDDRMLKDIGLSRSAVEGALAAGFDQDPSALLQRPSPSHAVSEVERAARVAWLRAQG